MALNPPTKGSKSDSLWATVSMINPLSAHIGLVLPSLQ